MTCTCTSRICALCGHPLGLAWLTEIRVDPLLGESQREIHFECHDREQARKKPFVRQVGIWHKPKSKRKRRAHR